MAVVRWVFEDPNTLDTYEFAINPSEGGSPSYNKTITLQATSAPDGKVVSFEGRDQPQTLEFSGVLFTEAEFNAFVEWWNKRYQIKVTDDLGRIFWIQINSFNPTRKRAMQHPWKHDYNITATVVDWP
jgi:hypothetical protein